MRKPRKATERRNKARFPMLRDLRYKLLEENTVVASGVGGTLDMSSSGVAFAIDQPLKPGSFIEISVSWPVLLDRSCPMRLNVFGRVQRTDNEMAVCTVEKYEFRTQARTQAKAFQAAAPLRSDASLQRWADSLRREDVKTREANI